MSRGTRKVRNSSARCSKETDVISFWSRSQRSNESCITVMWTQDGSHTFGAQRRQLLIHVRPVQYKEIPSDPLLLL